MAITNAQQYQQLVNKSANGKRPGYRGSDMATVSGGTRAANTSQKDTSGADYGGGNQGRDAATSSGADDRGSNLQNYNQQVATGTQLPPQLQRPIELNKREQEFKNFLDRRNKVKGFGFSKFFEKPMQKFSDFNAAINRPFFENVIRAGKFNYTTKDGKPLSFDMTEDELEDAYQDYMSSRLGGEIDAYGNPLNTGNDGGDQIIPFMAQAPSNMDQEPEEPFQRNFRLMADGGRAEFAEGGIMPRLSDLSGNVSSAEQMLQEINQRLQSAESTLGEGGAMQQPALQQPIGQPTQTTPFGGVVNNPDPKYSSFEEAFDAYKDNPFVGKDIASGDLSFKDFSNQMNLSSGAYGMHGAGGVPAGGNFGGFGGYSFNDETNEITRRPSPQANMPLGLLQPAMQSPLQTTLGLADGGRAALAEGGMPYEGGIMDLESSRQMYGLGKLVKKIGRSVKKIAKSPIGKAALLYFGGNALAGGGLKSFLLGSNAGPSFSKTGLLQKMFLKNPSTGFSLGNLSGTAVAGIPAALSYFMTPEEEKQQAMNYGADIDDPKTIMNNPSLYINRRLAAEGGSMDEPVAKKTMPLLDMDGQEMDLRAEGGFVPIGRMEKADDVPARLSKNEFVFTAEAVRNAGEGDVDKGAEVMYNMMKNLESGGEVSEESQGLEGAREMFQTSQRLEEVI